MTNHDDRLGPTDGGDGNGSDSAEQEQTGDATNEVDPTFADGTAREGDDPGQPLTREDEGMDR